MQIKLYNIKLLYLYILSWIAIANGYSNDTETTVVSDPECTISSETLPFEDCGSQYDILYVGVTNCLSIPCQMSRGTTVLVRVIFDDNGHKTSFLRHDVAWILNAIKTNAIIRPDPCVDNDHCLNEDQDPKSYIAKVFVSNNLPNIHGTMKWTAVDQTKKTVICFKIPVAITTDN